MRVAIWIYGGIGGGNFSQGTPALHNLVSRLADEHEITVFSILPSNPDFVSKYFRFRSAARWISNTWLRMAILVVLFIVDHLKKRYQLIHGIWIYPAATIAVVLGRLLGINSIASAHGGEAAALPSINYGNMLGGRSKKWTLWTCHKATLLNFISEFQVKQMQNHGLQRNDYTIIPFGADNQMFYPIQNQPFDKIRILHVANLTEVKDQKTLLRAFHVIRQSHPAELRIVGPDHLNGKLQRLIQELKLDDCVSFYGVVSHKEICKQFHWANIMLHTSLYEGLPATIIEAMASGLPVVSTPVGIVADLGPDYFEIFPCGNHQAAARQVLAIRNDESLRNDKRDKALQWAKTHDIKWTTNKFDELYQSLIK